MVEVATANTQAEVSLSTYGSAPLIVDCAIGHTKNGAYATYLCVNVGNFGVADLYVLWKAGTLESTALEIPEQQKMKRMQLQLGEQILHKPFAHFVFQRLWEKRLVESCPNLSKELNYQSTLHLHE